MLAVGAPGFEPGTSWHVDDIGNLVAFLFFSPGASRCDCFISRKSPPSLCWWRHRRSCRAGWGLRISLGGLAHELRRLPSGRNEGSLLQNYVDKKAGKLPAFFMCVQFMGWARPKEFFRVDCLVDWLEANSLRSQEMQYLSLLFL